MKQYHLMITIRMTFGLLMLGWAILSTVPAQAADLVVTRYFSGLWDQPKQESQGIILQIIDQEEDTKKAVAYWFTYGDDSDTAWYMGIGQVEGDQVVMTLYTAYGVSFMEDDLPGNASVFELGTLVLSFRNCNHGTATFETPEEEIGSGEFEIKKLAGLYHSRCSGGISDDTPSNAKPLMMEVGLDPVREGISGKGKAKFWERADRSDFHVSAEDIPDGEYQIHVCGGAVGPLVVANGEGQTEFRSPEADGKLLLLIDPRDCTIELRDGEGAVLSSGENVLAEKTKGNSDGNGRSEVDATLDNTGVLPEAEGEASYLEKNNSTEFEVEIENLPAGLYPLHVGGMERGQIEVAADEDDDDGTLKGKLRFSEPQKEDREWLNFDPRGLWVEVYSGGDIILEGLFPEE